jgi:hypothetical protein
VESFKPTVSQTEYEREAWRLSNMSVFLGHQVVGEYMRSVNVQLEIDFMERLMNE